MHYFHEEEMVNTKEDCISSLVGSLTRTARWRDSLQKKYPNDARLGRAAATLTRLADDAVNLSDEQWSALQPFYNWRAPAWGEAVSQAARLVDFQKQIRTFPAFVNNLVRILTEERAAA